MVSLVVLDSLDKKVSEDSLAFLGPLDVLFHHSWWRKETLETLELMAYLVFLDPEVTKVFQVCLVVRVCLVFLVLLSRVKGSQDSLGSLVYRELQASLDQKGREELLDSLA